MFGATTLLTGEGTAAANVGQAHAVTVTVGEEAPAPWLFYDGNANIHHTARRTPLKVGTVRAMNPRRGMLVIEIDGYGHFSIFEILDGVDIKIGDEVRGKLDTTGSQKLMHSASRRWFEVYGEGGYARLESACKSIGL
ncbi:hypothetical protein O4443_07895 [Xylella fastidiosa subsp. pauca]|uniref:hypothetical protein n=1 Tax=Xylella fastidiosa TaxID=2371 RepID=UPI00249EE096|nr:hypothetical protein [Xylella fastidiosa]WGZ35915.1 hypothetical protein O4443_07895 [Xylella fastidiosa subsp. pauca]